MIKLTNNSGKKIDITESLSIEANNYIIGDIEITPRIYQMMNMGLITLTNLNQENTENNEVESFVTPGAMRRKQIMNKIKTGYSKPSIPLDSVIRESNEYLKAKVNRRKVNK